MSDDNTLSPVFTHLHVHSEYSLTDGAISISKLIEEVKKEGTLTSLLPIRVICTGLWSFI